jgi:hypothetical protein
MMCHCKVQDLNTYLGKDSLMTVHEMKVAAHQQPLDGRAAGGCSFKVVTATLVVRVDFHAAPHVKAGRISPRTSVME